MKKRFAAFVLPVGLVAAIAVVLLLGDAVLWRSQVLLLKARGELDFITWDETFRWMLPGSPVYLSNLIEGRNPHVALTNTRYVSPEDAAEGELLFGQNCSGCHGGGGEGANGPALNAPSRFRSDWALYRTIRQGIPGTSMPPHDLRDPAIWQIITYLATLAPDESAAVAAIDVADVDYPRIVSRDLEMANWMSYSGGYKGQRYSALSELDTNNVDGLALKWVYQSDTRYNKFQVNPLIVDGVMFISEPQGRISALDAASGEPLWVFERPLPDPDGLVSCCGVTNRGVAVLGDKVFVTTMDARLLALDIRTGRLQWDTEVADYRVGYTITAAPLAIDGKVITGVAGGEMGIRGFVAAYDAATGEQAWRFDTVPAPGEPGSETWNNPQWEIGGAATWMTGSYDPELDLVYWGTSHTVHEPDAPGGEYDKLYGSSILALRGATGARVWHYQATPDDIHGFDAAQVPVLVDVELDGTPRKLLLNGNRNGFLYVLDRASGELISASEFTRQTWANEPGRQRSPGTQPRRAAFTRRHAGVAKLGRRNELVASHIQSGHGAALPAGGGRPVGLLRAGCEVRVGQTLRYGRRQTIVQRSGATLHPLPECCRRNAGLGEEPHSGRWPHAGDHHVRFTEHGRRDCCSRLTQMTSSPSMHRAAPNSGG